MKTKIILALLILALTACAPAVTPTISNTDIQNTAIAAAWTSVALTPIAPPPAAPATSTFTPTRIPVTATATMAVAQEPPVCTFPLAQTTMEESTPEEYTFSEPRVVLADPKGNFVVGDWLPNSQQVLITRTIIENHYAQYQSIELFNPRKVKVQVYAKRGQTSYSPPVWVAGLNVLMYPETKLVSSSYDNRGMIIQSSVVLNQSLWLV